MNDKQQSDLWRTDRIYISPSFVLRIWSGCDKTGQACAEEKREELLYMKEKCEEVAAFVEYVF